MLDEKKEGDYVLRKLIPLLTLLSMLNDDCSLLSTLPPPDGAYF